MSSNSENVILFPKLQKRLEEESLFALQEKRYEEALGKLDLLLSYHIDNHEILIGKLICLMELGRTAEAQDLCEELLQLKNEDYYHYVHIYLTILFQTNQYDLLMEQVKYEFENGPVPDLLEEQFKQLYDMSEKMKMDLAVENKSSIIEELYEAINQDNHLEQWRIVDRMRSMKVQPDREVLPLLTNEHVHPVIKTALLIWLKENKVSDEIEIHKFSLSMYVVPFDLQDMKSNDIYKRILTILRDMEQANPTLFQLLEQLLYRYVYVVYPFMPSPNEAGDIAEAIKKIGEQYLHIPTSYDEEEVSETIARIMKEISMCDSLYLSIIEE
ncbi:tetratricopeptide repeat protein [Oceanobacillus polygoni]|uniref:Tetratricopeptide (TPR) repeat protein n=1 Tax=Oceanobacillus polygoni TaxID=1235259 RepID=A0A9X0YRM9_9BACI|nr:tetratricopeptide repeat protein [Oceanobacillus polygoni]MBP2077419.1 tetratricopeptide (TPR) repeat protein [Oceanobacillus polygoni]